MMKVSKTSKKGFTLVELLVVIGIIGLLAAIILPKFTGYTGKAIMKDAVSQTRTVYTQASAYYAENGQYPASIAALITEVGKAGITAVDGSASITTDKLNIVTFNSTTGALKVTLNKGGKNYTVDYDANGKVTESAIP